MERRLTKKSGYHYYAYGIKEKENKNGSKRQYGNPITKLGRLEDIEEKHDVKSVDDLDKRLTALKIIKEKMVNVYMLSLSIDEEDYNRYAYMDFGQRKLTREEYSLLREVLL